MSVHPAVPASVSNRPASYARMFDDRVSATPHRDAFRFRAAGSWQTLTWKQTADKVYDLAAGLIALGVQPEERVAIAAGTRIEWLLADQAIMSAGAATTTVYPSTSAEDVEYILADSESKVVFAENAAQVAKIDKATLPALLAIVVIDGDGGPAASHEAPVLTFDELTAKGAELLATDPAAVSKRTNAVQPEHLATLIYTSGTTGRPKGVRLVNDNWTYEAVAIDALGILSADDIQYLWLPLSHVLGKVLLVAQIRIGFVTAVDGDLDRIVENLGVIKPTWMGGAPRIFEKVRNRVMLTAAGDGGAKAKIFEWAFDVGIAVSRLRQSGRKPGRALAAKYAVANRLVFKKIRRVLGGNIKFFVSGSAPLSPEVAQWFDAAGMTILEGYGLTESSAFSFVNLPHDNRIGTCGRPAPGTEVTIASDGEIMLRGGGVMRGYHHNDDATTEVLSADGWLATGDIGEVTDGYLKVTDRKKDLIKTSGGKYVAPQKVEGIFKAICPYASQIVLHGDGRKFVSALITLDEEAISKWGARNGLDGRPAAEIAQSEQVRTLIAGYVDEVNSKVERWETIKEFAILPADLSVESGELTPSMKVRRLAVEKQYARILDSFYKD
ncbi:MAG: long-chain fatty acid--CoA ligase [Actinomycetota bacterium]|nr:long-chain fatty acid--CoA ligase [Actinomycetota bacterium]